MELSNELQIFKQQEVLGKQFTIYGDAENPKFLAKDVAEWIEYDKSSVNKMLNAVDEDEKVRKSVPNLGGYLVEFGFSQLVGKDLPE